MIRKFDTWKGMGYAPERVVDLMVEKGWQSFNPTWNHGMVPQGGDKRTVMPYQEDEIAKERRERERELEEDKRLHPELYEEDAEDKLKALGMDFSNPTRRANDEN